MIGVRLPTRIQAMTNVLRETFSFVKVTFGDALRVLSSKDGIRSLYEVSLYRNAVYLMVTAVATAVLGLAFWVIVARLYSVSDVGLGSALLSVGGLLSWVGTLGLGYGIIRYLPNLKDKAGLLNSSLTFAGLATVLIAFIFLAGITLWSPGLIFVRQRPLFLASFIVFICASALGMIVVQAFVAFRRASFTTANAIIASLVKIALVIGFASAFKTFGIFASWGLAAAVSLAICLLIFLPRILRGYFPSPSSWRHFDKELLSFSFTNYLSETLWTLPTWTLPLLMLNLLGAEANAYFFVAWTISILVLATLNASATSLFAEGSSVEGSLGNYLGKSLKFTVLLFLPAMVILIAFGDKLLLLFGGEYSTQGKELLWILAVGMLPASMNYLYLSAIRVEKKLKDIILMSISVALGTLILSYILIPHLGIYGAGVGWLTTHALIALVVVPKLLRRLKAPSSISSAMGQMVGED